jgi:hypothetical protein
MIECKFERVVFVFDGHVIHRYHPQGASTHFYIDHVQSVEIISDKKDRKYLQLNQKEDRSRSIGIWPNPEIPQATVPQAQAFVEEVMQAIASRQE